MESAFGVEHGGSEISKLGGPKVRYQGLVARYSQEQGKEKKAPDPELDTHYKGKSMILRRDKYQVVGSQKAPKGAQVYGYAATPNLRAKRGFAHAVDDAYKSKSKKINYRGSSYKVHNHVEKGFSFKMPKPPANPSKAFKSGKKIGGATKKGVGVLGSKAGTLTTSLGAGTTAAGGKVAGAGQAMQAHPFKTGAAIVGGTSVGLTGGVYARMNGGAKKPEKTPGAP